jgi:hypothetical protein
MAKNETERLVPKLAEHLHSWMEFLCTRPRSTEDGRSVSSDEASESLGGLSGMTVEAKQFERTAEALGEEATSLIWSIAQEHFPGAVQIADRFHAHRS